MAERVVAGPGGLLRVLVATQWPWAVALGLACQLRPLVGAPFVVLAALFLSAAVHEAGHLLGHAALHGWGRSVLCTRLGLALSVRTPDASSARRVAAAGPALAGAIGAALVVLALLGPAGIRTGLVGGAFALHLLGLLPGSSDGDRLWALVATPGARDGVVARADR